MQIFIKRHWKKTLDLCAMNGKAVGIRKDSRKEKTACIFRFIKRTHRNTVPLCAVQRAQQGTAVSTDGMSRILSDASVFIPGASAYDRKIQFVVFAGSEGFAGVETGSVENAAFRKEEQGVAA